VDLGNGHLDGIFALADFLLVFAITKLTRDIDVLALLQRLSKLRQVAPDDDAMLLGARASKPHTYRISDNSGFFRERSSVFRGCASKSADDHPKIGVNLSVKIALKASRLHRTAVSGQILLEQRSDVRPERSFRDFARRWCACSKRDESVPQFTTRAHSS